MRKVQWMKNLSAPAALLILLAGACADDNGGAPVNDPCSTNKDCADHVCWSGTCATLDKKKGERCQGNGDCRSFNCISGFCLAGEGVKGSACVHDEQCFDGRCGPKGSCIGLGQDGGLPPDAAKADIPLLDAAKPDLPTPDAPRPDAPRLDALVPDKKLPDAPAPDAPMPDAPAPDALVPDALVPDAPVPDLMPPDQMQPDMSLCGNKKLDPTEVCDGALLGGKTCKTQGYNDGALKCSSACTLDAGLCYRILDPGGISLGKTVNVAIGLPRVASDGSGFLVVWQRSGPADIFGTLIDAKGKAGSLINIAITSPAQSMPAVKFGGKDYQVIWRKGGDIFGTTVSKAGVLGSPVGSLIYAAGKTGAVQGTGLSFDGSNHLVALVTAAPGSSFNHVAKARRVSPAGTAFGSTLNVGPVIYSTGGLHRPAAASNGKSHLVIWNTPYDIHGARVSSAGVLLDTKALPLATGTGNQIDPEVAGGGGGFLVVWQDSRAGGYEIMGRPVDASGKVGKEVWIAVTSNQKCNPQAAFDGKHFLVVWGEGNSCYGSIRGIRVDTQGKAVDPAPITLSGGVGGTARGELHVAYGGGQFLVAWLNVSGAVHSIKSTRLKFGAP